MLNQLVHVSNINKNLISVSKFARNNNVFFEFNSNSYHVKKHDTKKMIVKGTREDGLYVFQNFPQPGVFSAHNTIVASFQSAY